MFLLIRQNRVSRNEDVRVPNEVEVEAAVAVKTEAKVGILAPKIKDGVRIIITIIIETRNDV